jgi:predicted ATPase
VPDVPSRAGRTVPVPASSLIGREDNLATVDRLLDDSRLVTLVGPGGVGKTRLALESLRRRAARHASGTRIVELTTLSDPAAVPAAMVAAIGVAVDGDTSPSALRRAGGLDVLVLLDNCEHVIDSVAETVEHLLVGGRARVLATSRERLGVPGETVLPVTPLPVSGDAPPARALFLDRAAAAGLGPAAYALDTDVVDRVVSRLDGLPLAIEMAAARAPLLGLTELADALDRGLDEGTTSLRTPYRSAPERHRTLRAVIAWSEALLDPAEHAALVTWPVFAGPVDAADAAAVLGAGQGVVESLVLRSLLLPLPGPDGTMRYRMLHTVRAAVLASDHGVDDALRRRHAEHAADVAAWCSRALRSPEEPQAVARITGFVAELRAAHLWARSHDRPLAAAISRSLHPYAMNAVDEEVLDWGTRLLTASDGAPGPDGPAAAAHVALAAQLTIAGELGAAAARARDALVLATDDVTRLQALEVLADTAIYDGRLSECRAWGEQMVELSVAAGDAHYLAMAAGSVSLARAYAGDAVGATTALAECRTRLAEVTPTPAPTDEGWLRYAEGEIALDTDPARALRSLERAMVLADRVGNRYLGGVARVSATSLRARHGDPADALDAFADVIRWWLDRGDRTHLVTTLRNALDLLVRVGADAAAAELWGAVGHDRPSPSFGGERTRLDANRDVLTARLEPTELRDRMATGAARDLEEAAREVLSAIGGLRRT